MITPYLTATNVVDLVNWDHAFISIVEPGTLAYTIDNYQYNAGSGMYRYALAIRTAKSRQPGNDLPDVDVGYDGAPLFWWQVQTYEGLPPQFYIDSAIQGAVTYQELESDRGTEWQWFAPPTWQDPNRIPPPPPMG